MEQLARDIEYIQDGFRDTILVGSCHLMAKSLPSDLVQCIITSPPYFGHRDYASSSSDPIAVECHEIGREQSPDQYIQDLVAIFTELKRVMKNNGTLWLNLGDTYRDNQLLGIPWRVALALQDSGWFLRSEIIWNKPNAMPSSVSNRPTVSHEHIFLLSKNKDYLYNADSIREPHITFSDQSKMRGGRKHLGVRNGTPENGKNKDNPNLHNGRWDQAFHPLGRNKRTVWEIPLGKFRGTHFAVFPEQLVEICLKAGTRSGDIVLDPFMGAGTVAVVAVKHERHFIGIELIPEYAEMAQERIRKNIGTADLFSTI